MTIDREALQEQIAEARKAEKAVYLAAPESVARDLARIIKGLADRVEALSAVPVEGEVEWEYGVRIDSGSAVIGVPLTHPDDPLYADDPKVRRRKAGPWQEVAP